MSGAPKPGGRRRKRHPLDEKLYQAAAYNDLDKFRQHADAGARMKMVNGNKETVLHWACFHGNVEMCRVILERDFEPQVRDARERTPVHCAAYNGHVVVTALLLSRGAERDAMDRQGNTALHLTASKGHAEVVKVLLAHGANASVRDNRLVCPLHFAAYYGHPAVAQLLIEAPGVDVNALDKDGRTALIDAARKGQHEVVRVLLSHATPVGHTKNDTKHNHHDSNNNQKVVRIDIGDKRCYTAAHWAARHGYSETLQQLIHAGANIDLCEHQRRSCVHLAAETGHAACVDMLCRAGAELGAPDAQGLTPMHVAAQGGHAECIQLLAMAGAHTDEVAQAESFRTPLHEAAARGHDEATRALLACGANPNAADCTGATPLILACSNSHTGVMRLLLRTPEQDVSCVDVNGRNVLHWCSVTGDAEAATMLLSTCSEGELPLDLGDDDHQTALILAVLEDHADVAGVLISYGAELHWRDETGATALHHAVFHGTEKCVALLLANGAKANFADSYGRGALHWAVQANATKCVTLLLEHDAAINGRDMVGDSPLHDACTVGSVACCILLLRNGADTDAGNNLGHTALHVAAANGHFDCVTLLISMGASVTATTVAGETPRDLATAHGHADLAQFLEVAPARSVEASPVLRRSVPPRPRLPLQQLPSYQQQEEWMDKEGGPVDDGMATTPLFQDEQQQQQQHHMDRGNGGGSGSKVMLREKAETTDTLSSEDKEVRALDSPTTGLQQHLVARVFRSQSHASVPSPREMDAVAPVDMAVRRTMSSSMFSSGSVLGGGGGGGGGEDARSIDSPGGGAPSPGSTWGDDSLSATPRLYRGLEMIAIDTPMMHSPDMAALPGPGGGGRLTSTHSSGPSPLVFSSSVDLVDERIINAAGLSSGGASIISRPRKPQNQKNQKGEGEENAHDSEDNEEDYMRTPPRPQMGPAALDMSTLSAASPESPGAGADSSDGMFHHQLTTPPLSPSKRGGGGGRMGTAGPTLLQLKFERGGNEKQNRRPIPIMLDDIPEQDLDSEGQTTDHSRNRANTLQPLQRPPAGMRNTHALVTPTKHIRSNSLRAFAGSKSPTPVTIKTPKHHNAKRRAMDTPDDSTHDVGTPSKASPRPGSISLSSALRSTSRNSAKKKNLQGGAHRAGQERSHFDGVHSSRARCVRLLTVLGVMALVALMLWVAISQGHYRDDADPPPVPRIPARNGNPNPA